MRAKTEIGIQSVDLKVHVLEETVDTGEEWEMRVECYTESRL